MEKTVNVGNALAEHIIAMDYGDILHYQEIERITKFKRKTNPYYAAIAKAKKMSLANGKMIQRIGGGDYRVIYPGDYVNAYAREVRIARNRVKKGAKILKGAPVNDMTVDERQTHANVQSFHARLQAQIRGSYVEVKSLAGKRQHPFSETAEKAGGN